MRIIRLHRGSFADSMETVEHIEPSSAAVVDFVNRNYFTFVVKEEDLIIEKYADDKRNGWDTYIVYVKHRGVVAFLNGSLII